MVAAPLDEARLLERADLAGDARVMSLRNGRARLRFVKLRKGRPLGGRGFLSRFRGPVAEVALRLPAEPMSLGEWTDGDVFQPGTLVRTHLVWDDTAAYVSVWWNATTRIAG